jgi:UDP-N-acetylmuramyl pentapeptide synthase
LGLLGWHNATNALAATALAVAVGVSGDAIVSGLRSARPAPGRLALRQGRQGVVVIDDSYNANPTALIAALDVLAEHRQERDVAIHALLGEMLELGPESAIHHERVGRHAAQIDVKTLVSSGEAARAYGLGAAVGGMEESRIFAVDTPEEAASLVLDRIGEGDVILVKGSRGAQMERAVGVLCEGVEEGGHEGAP